MKNFSFFDDKKTDKQKNAKKKKSDRAAAHRIDLKKVIGHALRAHSLRTILSCIVIVLSIILEVIPPLILANAIDELTADQMVSLTLGIVYFLLLACSGLCDAVREALIVATGEGITHALRSEMMKKLHRLPASYFTGHEAGAVSSIQVNDVDAIEDMFSSGIVSMFTDLGTVFAVLAVIFSKSIGLGILLLIALPLLMAFTRNVQKKMLAAHTDNRKATAEASGILPETLHIIRSLHVYRAEQFAEKRYNTAIQKSFRALERTNYYDAVYSPVIMTASAIVIGIMMSLSGQSGLFREWFGMSVGTAVAVIAYVNQIFTPLSSIGMEIQTVQSAAAGWKRVQGFLDEAERPLGNSDTRKYGKPMHNSQNEAEGLPVNSGSPDGTISSAVHTPETDQLKTFKGQPAEPDAKEHCPEKDRAGGRISAMPDITHAAEASPAPGAPGAIEICHVSFSYDGENPVLDDFSLDVKKREFVTLTGRTGAGKSTLFKLLLGLYAPDQGSIRVNGISPLELGDNNRRKIICCVEQKVTPVPGTIRDQITLGNPRMEDTEIWQALETVGLKATVSSLPGQLNMPYRDSLFSQGQKQLLMIARAIVSDPDILLLDEITAGLDSATEKMIVDALEKASADRTVVSISHRLSEVMPGRLVRIF